MPLVSEAKNDMNIVAAAAVIGVGAYILSQAADYYNSNPPLDQDTTMTATPNVLPKVMWSNRAVVKDSTRSPPMSNMVTDPTLQSRPSGQGSSSDDTGTRQEAITSKSMEQEHSPILMHVGITDP